MNSTSHLNVPHPPSHCGLAAATPSLALMPQSMPFNADYPQQRHGRSRLILDEHVRPCLHIADSRPSSHPGDDQIPIDRQINVTLAVIVAVSFLALC